ncbi:MAG: hypothetical protein JWN78_1185 [Bacteroidota bacterium]|nr:hypothetical protein [Bacteroidota bacterium]
MRSKLTGSFFLLAGIVIISIFYQYPTILHLLPQGSHMWRQADCMAMTQNYQQFHLPFFQPETYNLQSVNGKVAGELPLFYFLAAKFAHPKFALRLIHSIIFLFGIFSTYFIAFYFLRRRLLSVFCSVLLFTSPLLVFYGNNFLTDVPALSFAYMGWAIFLYNYKKNTAWLIIAFVCFTLSALLKASEVMNIAILLFFVLRIRNQESRIKTIFFLALASCLLILSWYFYARSYNQQNHDHYYFLRISPIWKLSLHDIGLALWRMTVSWSKNYFWRPTSVLLIISSYFLIKHRRRLGEELRMLITLSFAFTIFYILVFYQKMIGHEYYYVAFYIFVLFLLISFFKVYNYFYAENVFSHTAIFLFLLINIFYCRIFVAEKLNDNLYNGYLSSDEMQDFLNKKGATENKVVISIPDESTNKTLYQVKRKGYTEFNNYLSILKNKKADYIILGNESWLTHHELKPYLTDSLGNFHGIYLYKLKRD